MTGKTYILFAFDHYYPCGGINDVEGIYLNTSEESAIEKASKIRGIKSFDVAYLYCVDDLETVKEF